MAVKDLKWRKICKVDPAPFKAYLAYKSLAYETYIQTP